MPNGRGKNKARNKKRAHVVSQGTAKMSQHPLSEVEKAILGKGLVQSTRPVNALRAWSGVGEPKHPYDAEQAAWNVANLPFLAEFNHE